MLILLHFSDILTRVIPICGRRIMANIPAFQASDASSILAARTKEIDRAFWHGLFLWLGRTRIRSSRLTSSNPLY